MEITAVRSTCASNYTLSNWTIDDIVFCVAIELPLQPPVPGGLCAIPAGTYRVIIERSPNFSQLAGHDVFLPHLYDLPGYTTSFHGLALDNCGILIHGGNVVNGIPKCQPGGPQPGPYSVKDPLRTDSEGCLLVGTDFGDDKKSIINSQIALAKLKERIQGAGRAGQLVSITLVDKT